MLHNAKHLFDVTNRYSDTQRCGKDIFYVLVCEAYTAAEFISF